MASRIALWLTSSHHLTRVARQHSIIGYENLIAIMQITLRITSFRRRRSTQSGDFRLALTRVASTQSAQSKRTCTARHGAHFH